ncbi:hypothetical protein [Amycolatopsis rubida]|uniref:hypothetical protein n=1 Tax=Amycolatopsis rubida TaxID=112413 RepID=UPI000B8A005A|nr:hypothetical protein [Amycolatopsis rubida]
MEPKPARRAGRREALRRTLRDVRYLAPAAVACWAVTGATAGSAAWAAGWFVLVAAACFGLNRQYAHRRTAARSAAVRRHPRLRARTVAGTPPRGRGRVRGS